MSAGDCKARDAAEAARAAAASELKQQADAHALERSSGEASQENVVARAPTRNRTRQEHEHYCRTLMNLQQAAARSLAQAEQAVAEDAEEHDVLPSREAANAVADGR